MGMDVVGIGNPDAYFRNNVWWWRPLAEYIINEEPEIASHCECWGSNDGDGLNRRQSKQLAEALQTRIDSGEVKQYEVERKSHLENLPLVDCELCEGTGGRKEVPHSGAGDHPCNACDSTGKVKQWDTHYPFNEENVIEFIKFLRICKGFQIW